MRMRPGNSWHDNSVAKEVGWAIRLRVHWANYLVYLFVSWTEYANQKTPFWCKLRGTFIPRVPTRAHSNNNITINYSVIGGWLDNQDNTAGPWNSVQCEISYLYYYYYIGLVGGGTEQQSRGLPSLHGVVGRQRTSLYPSRAVGVPVCG